MSPPPQGGAGPPSELGPDAAVHAQRYKTLLVLCLSLVVVMVANISLNVALPALARDLDASTSSLQWMVDAYALVFAGLLFTAGTIGDRFGRKGALQGGLVLFLVGSAVAAMAGTAATVIAGRAIMGLAAALVMPSTLSILVNVFPPDERSRAIAIWAGIASGGAAVGPVASGLLLEHYWWGSVFLVNVPVVVLALLAGRRFVPRSADPDHQPVDLPGVALSILGVGALVYAIIEAPAHGWTGTRTVATFAFAALALALFARREHRTGHPMLDLALFRDRRFSVASTGIGLTFFAMFGVFFVVTQYLQLVLGYSALQAGLCVLPVPLVIMVLAPQLPGLVAAFGAARVVPVGLGLMATGLGALSRLGPDSPVVTVVVALVPMAAGMAATGPPLTTVLMASVPPGRAGVGSAMNDTSRELGGALGVAVLGSLLTTRFSSSLDPVVAGLGAQDQTVAMSGLAGALDVARGLAGPPGEALASAARAAFADGFGFATTVATVVVLVAAAGAACLLPRAAAPHAPASGATRVATSGPTRAAPTGSTTAEPEPDHGGVAGGGQGDDALVRSRP